MKKKIYTKKEFEKLLSLSAKKMYKDIQLRKDALKVKIKAGHEYYWLHQTSWMGEPCIQLTQDLFALQEAIYKSKPEYIIEVGVAWGGSTLFYASLLQTLSLTGVIGIDIFMPNDMKKRIIKKKPKNVQIKLIEGSSIDEINIDKISKIVKNKSAMVILDSNHTHEHVLKELNLYSKFIKKGFYLVCMDTIIDEQPPAKKRPRDWDKGGNPATALREFLKYNKNFKSDRKIEDKMLLSNSPNGYLRRTI